MRRLAGRRPIGPGAFDMTLRGAGMPPAAAPAPSPIPRGAAPQAPLPAPACPSLDPGRHPDALPDPWQCLTIVVVLAKRVVLPAFDERGNLPPGLHRAGWAEFVPRFGCTEHRRALIAGMSRAIESLGRAGCSIVYIDGSLAAAKQHPGDYDGCWDETGVNQNLLDPVLRNLGDKRRA